MGDRVLEGVSRDASIARPRRLSWAPRPVAGESLLSWADQVALGHGVWLWDAVIALGLGEGMGAVTLHWNRQALVIEAAQWGMSPGLEESVVFRSGLSRAQVRLMTLARYRGAVDWPNRPQASGVFAFTRHPWAWRDRSNLCPYCLAENGGRWMLRWRLVWMFLCPEHGCYLVDRCRCGAMLHHARSLAGVSRCTAGAARNRPGSCQARMVDLPAVPVRDRGLVAIQRRILDLVESEQEMGAEAREALFELVCVARLAMLVGEPFLLAGRGVDPVVFDHFMALSGRITGERAGARVHAVDREPLVPVLAAGLLRIAAEVVFADDLDAAARRFVACSAGRTERSDPWVWAALTEMWRLAPRVRAALIAGGVPEHYFRAGDPSVAQMRL